MAFGTAVKIETITVAAGGTSSIIFNNIPQTYDDLKIVASARGTRSFFVDDLIIRFNGSTTNYSGKRLLGAGGPPGSSPSADSLSDIRGAIPGSTTTADIFGNNEFYIKNYTSSNNKSVSIDAVGENNTVDSYNWFFAGLWSNSSAITSITMLANNGNLTEFSTFTLYGITRIPQGAKATGGVIYDDSSYWYHVFTSSGTFTPSQSITADVLVVAGGGSGGYSAPGGGGAGGLLAHTNQSLTATSYTVTIGGGGAAQGPSAGAGNKGTNSQFGSLTASEGGGAGRSTSGGGTPNGGSGGGGAESGANSAGGTATSGQGNNGGNNNGGGGGAGQAGAVGYGSGTVGATGLGGDGVSTYSSWGLATNTGENISGTVWYAGGGGGYGKPVSGPVPANGGKGGGGAAGASGVAGLANSGAGSGADSAKSAGSGIVIVRYAK